MPLRPSQVETLRHFDMLEGAATAGEIAARIDRTEYSAEKRIGRLVESGHLSKSPPPRYWDMCCLYSLTQLGREALEGSDA